MSNKEKKKCCGKCKGKVEDVVDISDKWNLEWSAPEWYEPTQPDALSKNGAVKTAGGPNPTKVYVVVGITCYPDEGMVTSRVVGVFETHGLAKEWVKTKNKNGSFVTATMYSIKRMTLRYSSMMTAADW